MLKYAKILKTCIISRTEYCQPNQEKKAISMLHSVLIRTRQDCRTNAEHTNSRAERLLNYYFKQGLKFILCDSTSLSSVIFRYAFFRHVFGMHCRSSPRQIWFFAKSLNILVLKPYFPQFIIHPSILLYAINQPYTIHFMMKYLLYKLNKRVINCFQIFNHF